MSALIIVGVLAAAAPQAVETEAPTPRPITVHDYFALQDIAVPRVSPDGEWVAYTVTTQDLEEDASETRLWRVPLSGGEPRAMTAPGDSVSEPRWSPDGRYLSFLSERSTGDEEAPGDGKSQVWGLDRRGGEAIRLTAVEQGVEAHEWAPDGRRLVLVIRDPKPKTAEGEEKAGPWVVDRLQFKKDGTGYVDRRRTHLYVFDLETKKTVQITFGDYDDSGPAWSPDGRWIAFVSNRTERPDSNYNTDLWRVPASATASSATPSPEAVPAPVRITRHAGADSRPVWHPEGTHLAYTTTTRPKLIDYAQEHVAVIAASGGEARVLTESLDRNAWHPRFSPDGSRLYFELEDGGAVHLAAVPFAGGKAIRVIGGKRQVKAFDVVPSGALVTLASEPHLPGDLFFLDRPTDTTGGNAAPGWRRLTRANEALLGQLELASVAKTRARSGDGTEIEAFLYTPPDHEPGQRHPTLLWLHGGPMDQHDWGFDFEGQLFAAHGYVVVMPNPRGSTGYGQDFTLGIWRDWGRLDTMDVLAAVDRAVELGYADKDQLGVGGWSYGGMLTNYVITTTDRFKAAISGAGGGLWVAHYGHDIYQHWYETELGLPWENRDLWERLSPWNRVQKITTPTMWVGGEKDWSVPVLGSEHMYMAAKRLGREALLVVYPGEDHSIDQPSHAQDLYTRYLAWFNKHVKKNGAGEKGAPARVSTDAGR
jgi:dipeptidyl aminopeptidase/acylaminoacyl peptidase